VEVTFTGISSVTVEWNEHEPPRNAQFTRRKILRKRRKSPQIYRNRGKSPHVSLRAKMDFFDESSRVTAENSSLTIEKIRLNASTVELPAAGAASIWDGIH
jgi:hypothetical protein